MVVLKKALNPQILADQNEYTIILLNQVMYLVNFNFMYSKRMMTHDCKHQSYRLIVFKVA